jgi:hypothetical protein
VKRDQGQKIKDGDCFVGSTKVSLLDGREVSLKELSETWDGKEPIYVYTMKEGKVSVGAAINPRLTKRDAHTVIVTLDNEEEVVCTSDHRWMLRNGMYKKAEDLKPDDSLMPLYRKPSEKGLPGYELYYCPIKEVWHYTHKMVAKDSMGLDVIPWGFIVHHERGPKNNDPRFLEILTRKQHMKIHQITNSGNSSPEARKKRSDSGKCYWDKVKSGEFNENYCKDRAKIQREIGRKNHRGGWKLDDSVSLEEIKEIASKCTSVESFTKVTNHSRSWFYRRMETLGITSDTYNSWFASREDVPRKDYVYLKTLKIEDLKEIARTCSTKKQVTKILNSSRQVLNRFLDKHGIAPSEFYSWIGKDERIYKHHFSIDDVMLIASESYSMDQVCEKLGCSNPVVRRILKENNVSIDEFYAQMENDSDPKNYNNHKVASVRPGFIEDVYSLTILDTENFALSSGVFVFNS